MRKSILKTSLTARCRLTIQQDSWRSFPQMKSCVTEWFFLRRLSAMSHSPCPEISLLTILSLCPIHPQQRATVGHWKHWVFLMIHLRQLNTIIKCNQLAFFVICAIWYAFKFLITSYETSTTIIPPMLSCCRLYRVVQKKVVPWFNFAIISVSVHRF